jgi:hypothetical protein
MTPRIQQRIRPVEPTTDDAVLIAVERRGWALLAAASLFALAFSGFNAAGGVVLGGAVGLLNFRLIKVYFDGVLRRGRRPARWVHALYMAKYAALALLLAAVFRVWGPHPLGVIGGFSISVAGLIWVGLAVPGGARKGEGADSMKGLSMTSRLARRMGMRA